LDEETHKADLEEVIRLRPVLPTAATRNRAETRADQIERDEILLLEAFLWTSAIASSLIGVILLVFAKCFGP
jgi:hypothetical protein